MAFKVPFQIKPIYESLIYDLYCVCLLLGEAPLAGGNFGIRQFPAKYAGCHETGEKKRKKKKEHNKKKEKRNLFIYFRGKVFQTYHTSSEISYISEK